MLYACVYVYLNVNLDVIHLIMFNNNKNSFDNNKNSYNVRISAC